MPTTARQAGSVPAVTKPLIRRPTLVRKHDEIEDQSSLAPLKRAKVTFDDNVEVNDLQAWEKPAELVQEEVRWAIQMHTLGDDSAYNEIRGIYDIETKEEKEISSSTLKNYTTALLSNVAALDKSCSSLIHTVLKSDWAVQREDYYKIYVRLLANLVSAQGTFLPDVLDMIVRNMSIVVISRSSLNGSLDISLPQARSRVHTALQHLLSLNPSASHTLLSILTSHFPHQDDSKRTDITYVNNLLKVISYVPELRGEVLALITDRLVKIDVQVQVDIEELADDVGEGLVHELPQARTKLADDPDDLEISDEDSDLSEDSDEEDNEMRRTKGIMRNVKKMDFLLDCLFRYYDQDFAASSITTRRNALETLLSQFLTIILPTHRSRHTQFLLFHFAQSSPEFVDTFVGTCAAVAFDKGQPSINRQAAAAYLASFVARGAQVPANIVRDVFDYLGSELNKLRKQYEPGCRGPDLRRYSCYYCLVQALLYIFCFRWEDLEYKADDDDEDEDGDLPSPYGGDHHWRPGVKETLALNIFSTLNPLKVCSPAIVTEFARIANHLGIVYVYGLLETNKRIRLSQYAHTNLPGSYSQLGRETALNARKDEGQYHLDEYFPFDPYHLPRSKKWVEADYREWSGIPGLDDEQVDSSESDVNETAGSDTDEETATDYTKESA